MGDLWWRTVDALRDWQSAFVSWMTSTRHAAYAVAACRIGLGLAVVGLLASNFSTRSTWVGQASIWAEPARSFSTFPELALLDGASPDVLLVVYTVTLLAAVGFTIGWHTKATNVVTYVGFIAVVAQNPVVGVQTDNLMRLALLWMLLTRAGDHWSWDARRRMRIEYGEISPRSWDEDVLPEWFANALHNSGLVALCTQTVLAYTGAGLDKIGQSAWQHGTALYTTLQLPESRPYPALADFVSQSSVVLAVLTYLVLFTQVFFGPLLLSTISRRIVVVCAVTVAVIFAILFAAPWAQLAVIAVTVLFVSDRTWVAVEDRVLEIVDPLASRFGDRVLDTFDVVGDYGRDGIDAVIRGTRRVLRRG
ncbi:MAG TPA: HTTM domain-containing protein [Aeromicrobium sp.]|nr:HTTM domain-containing protein [Aeromicrobium sp.]